MNIKITGGCQCGAIRYKAPAQPEELYVCHCAECRKQSSSAFGISYIVKSSDLEILQGVSSMWSRQADSGETIECFFCEHCGTRVWHGNPDKEKEVSIKGGSLDDPVNISNATHIWTSRKLPGIIIPEHSENYPQEP